MKLMIVSGISVVLLAFSGCTTATSKSLMSVAQDNAKRAAEYHKLVAGAKVEQARVQDFVKDWVNDCNNYAKTTKENLVLQMGKDGDPGCGVPETPAPVSTPASPAK